MPNYITIFFSAAALSLSIISLVITLIQKNKETVRNIRKTLSDALDSIAKINIETIKLSSDTKFDEEDKVALSRNYNSQRRILIAHADFLASKYPKLIKEIDCVAIAIAYSYIGDQNQAEYYWKLGVSKSNSTSTKLMNLRGFANFLFHQGKYEEGRQRFYESLKIELSSNDENNYMVADTYLMLANAEKEFGTKELFETNIAKAIEYCERINNNTMKSEMYNRIIELHS